MSFQTELTDRLRRACVNNRIANASVSLYRKGERFFTSLGNDETGRPFSESTPALAGCLSKPLTATLIAQRVSAGHLAFDDHIRLPLDTGRTDNDLLRNISIRHLLNHSHGLDDGAITEAPRTGNGSIDLVRLGVELQMGGRIFAPGTNYSYGDAGYWLLAGLLEAQHGVPYGELLVTDLLEPLGALDGFEQTHSSGGVSCPSFGAALSLSSRDMLRILEHHVSMNAQGQSLADLRFLSVSYPGWNPTSRAGCGGWNDHGDGWYGHNAIIGKHSAIVRFHPEKELALAITSHTTQAFQVLGSVFGQVLPEFSSRQPAPRRLLRQELSERDFDIFCGSYSNRAMLITVERSHHLHLPLRMKAFYKLHPNKSGKAFIDVSLHPAEQDLFYSVPGHREFFTIQFVPGAADEPLFLWNGTRLWRRTSGEIDGGQ